MPDENITARPPSSAPTASSNAAQVGLPNRPYSRSPPATYVLAGVIGTFSGESDVRPGRPAATTSVSRVKDRERAMRIIVRPRCRVAPMSATTSDLSASPVTSRKPCVLLVFGGRSSEHAVSCMTASEVLAVIDHDRYDVVAVGITRDGRWVRHEGAMATDDDGLPEVEASGTPVTLAGNRLLALEADGSGHELAV